MPDKPKKSQIQMRQDMTEEELDAAVEEMWKALGLTDDDDEDTEG
jgi:hypothetical protein